MRTQHREDFFRAFNQLSKDGPRNCLGVAVNGRGEDDAFGHADAEEVIDVHDDAVLRNAAEDGRVTSFLPPEVSE